MVADQRSPRGGRAALPKGNSPGFLMTTSTSPPHHRPNHHYLQHGDEPTPTSLALTMHAIKYQKELSFLALDKE